MHTVDLILGIIILVICLLVIILGLAQGKNNQSNSNAVTGGSNESEFSKNEGKTKEALLNRMSGFFMVLLFGLTLAITIISAWRN